MATSFICTHIFLFLSFPYCIAWRPKTKVIEMQTADYVEVPQEPNDDIIVKQPISQNAASCENWMTIPVGVNNCPSGLEYLSALDELLIGHKAEFELLTNFRTKSKFKVQNAQNQFVYFTLEDSNFFFRNILGRSRPFEMKILDNFQNEVMRFYRPYHCGTLSCLPGCSNTLQISAPPGQLIGYVENFCLLFKPKFNIKNSSGDVVLRIEGPACPFECFNKLNFKILNANDEPVGNISKQWSDFSSQTLINANYFSVKFPLNIDVRIKALIFASALLIDVAFYEK